ncbi:metalloendoproteinase 1-like [Trifolium pratense]|uniref:metalloendoproteinase 1-like n=1 Tax=Trifolium pratense TaxID=57577 RepID=UPI001E690B08|nr:metalloendoproteinase 1-like [Trifolium pratense]
MKSYSCKLQLLLILLLITVNTSTSFSFNLDFLKKNPTVKWFAKQAAKKVAKETAKSVLNYTINKIENPEEPSLPEEEIDGLYIIKEYLSDFGYLQQHGPFNNLTNNETTSAIEIYQRNFNLQAKGNLNVETLQQILIPRCGVPDINFEYNLSGTNTISWPKGNKWFPEGTNNLTYGFAPESKIPLNATKVFRNALTRWSTTTKVLNFTETSYDDANIKIGFYGGGVVDEIVVGGTIISLELNSSVNSGVILLDASKYWILPTDNYTGSWQDGEFDLETVAMHQIGHLLGLDHSFENDSIMYPAILPSQQRKVQISVSDNETIHRLYTITNTTKADANYGYVGSSSGLITSLFLGFAFVAMLN